MMTQSTLKTTFLKFIDMLPASIGYGIYHQLQTALNSGVLNKIEPNKKSFEKIEMILETQGQSLANKNVVEVGSGWVPLMPYFLKYFGHCNQVFTYDINDHYNKKWIRELDKYFRDEYKIPIMAERKSLTPDFVHYFPKENIIDAEFPGHVDLIFSRFVLEHVTPDDMRRMHEKFASEIAEDALILHLISPSDHRAYTDKTLSHYDFLRYSRFEWDSIQTKFDYHNRMRLPQYLKVFDEAGFDLLFLEYDKVDPLSEKYAKYKELKIHDDFVNFSEEEVLAGSINVLLRKKKTTA